MIFFWMDSSHFFSFNPGLFKKWSFVGINKKEVWYKRKYKIRSLLYTINLNFLRTYINSFNTYLMHKKPRNLSMFVGENADVTWWSAYLAHTPCSQVRIIAHHRLSVPEVRTLKSCKESAAGLLVSAFSMSPLMCFFCKRPWWYDRSLSSQRECANQLQSIGFLYRSICSHAIKQTLFLETVFTVVHLCPVLITVAFSGDGLVMTATTTLNSSI